MTVEIEALLGLEAHTQLWLPWNGKQMEQMAILQGYKFV